MHILPVTDPVLIFAVVMTIVVVAPLLAEKLRLPGIIGLITAGILFGPYVLDVLEHDKTIDLLGTIGLLYILFQAGLEINLAEVRKNKFHSLSFGLLTFFIPLIIGTVSALFILDMSLIASILLASMFSSHTLITYPTVSRMGLSKKSSVTSTIGGTIITDTLAFLVLAVVIAANHGSLDLWFWVRLSLLSAVYLFTVIVLLPILVRWFFRKFANETGVEEYVFTIAILFICAYLSHLIGLEPVIGAFLAGLVFNTMIPEKSTLMNRIQFVGNSLFIPFFLISVGMIIDVRQFFVDVNTLIVSAVMIIVAIVSKLIAAHLFGLFTKSSVAERNLIFALSVNQAAATLAAVTIGHRVGLFSDSVLAGTVMMILVTCFTGSLATRTYARKVLLEEKSVVTVPRKRATDRLLLPIKNERNIHHLVEFALLLKEKESHEPIYLLNVALDGKQVDRQLLEGEDVLAKALDLVNAAQQHAIPLTKIDINISSALLRSAQEHRVPRTLFDWNPEEKPAYGVFNRVIDQFIKNSNEEVFVSRVVQRLGITRAIVLIVPPLMNRQKGFSDSLYSVIKLTQMINAKLIICADELSRQGIEPIVAKKKLTLQYEFKLVNSWKGIDRLFDTMLSENDMIIQLLARPGQLAWRLSFDRLPHELATRFSRTNLIAVYPPSDPEHEYEDGLSSDLPLYRKLQPECFYFQYAHQHPERLFKDMCRKLQQGDRDAVYDDLVSTLRSSPIELSRQILLVHIHTREIDDYQLAVATNPDTFSVDHVSSRPRIIIILLSPESYSARSHLEMLSEIAQMVNGKDFINNLLSSEDYDQFIEKMDRTQERSQQS
jgi:Kef-type K+ transport system membrane component KefB/mannitol/fructose-specific phosphotransferase system IIA component (Ntr-type)